jgi:hypothetical protein
LAGIREAVKIIESIVCRLIAAESSFDRAKARVNKKSTVQVHGDTVPSSNGTKTLAQKYLISPEIFGEEQKRIFSKQWVCVGQQSDIATTGDYFLAEIAGESVLIVRDQFGKVRAFYNSCRHRGTRICEENKGHFARRSSAPIMPGHTAWMAGSWAHRTWRNAKASIRRIIL